MSPRPLSTLAVAVTLALAPGLEAAEPAPSGVAVALEAKDLERVEVTAERLDGYRVDVSTTAGKMPLPIMETPQSIVVVPEELLQDFDPIFLDDALRTVSGVNQDNTFGNTADGLTLRGFSADGLFRNGIRTLGSRSLTPSTQRIEVLKGPASLLYGNIEPGGLVNVVVKRPQFGDPLRTLEYQASDRGGSRWNADLTGPIGRVGGEVELAYRLVADRDTSDYWRNFGRYDNTFLAPSLSLRGDNLRATLGHEYHDRDEPFDRGTVVVGDRIADIPQTRRLGERFEFLTEETRFTELDIEYDLGAYTLLRVVGAYQDSEGDDLQARPRRVTVDSEGEPVLVRRVDGSFGRYADSRYLSANLVHEFALGGVEHTLLAGFDHERSVDGRAGFLLGRDEPIDRALDVFDPVYGTLDPSLATPIANGAYRASRRTSGFYLQDRMAFGDAWTLVLGGRSERFESVSRTVGVEAPTDDSDGDALLPQVGLVFQPRSWMSVYANYAESFQPNTFSPAELLPGSPTSFDPESGVSVEAGAKVEFGGLRLGGAVFRIQKENVLVIENQLPRLVDQARSRGIEFDLGGDLGPSTRLMASYAYIDSDDGEGRLLTNVPRHTVGAALSHSWNEGALTGLSAGVSAQYVGDRDGGANPGASPGGPEFFNMPSYSVVDVFAAYALDTSAVPLRFQLNLKNAFDERYFPSSGGSLRINPGQARTLYGSVTLRF